MRVMVLGLIITFVAVAGCGAGTDEQQIVPPRAGTFVDGGGKIVSLKDFIGRYVWIDYAAEWCAARQASHPRRRSWPDYFIRRKT